MTVVWERFAGSTDVFAVRLGFVPDPDGGMAADPEQSRSWGALQIWVEGKNLCSHVDQGETLQSAHWYLLPLLEWVAANWNSFLHEERLPNRNSEASAAAALRETRNAPLLYREADAVIWEEEWYEWHGRHAIRTAREGGILPNVVFRRFRDSIEVSWDDEPLPGAEDVRFVAGNGAVLLPPALVAEVLYEVVFAAASYLREACPESERLRALLDSVKRLGEPNERQTDVRLSWLAGLRVRPNPEQRALQPDLDDRMDARWANIVRLLQEGDDPRAASAALQAEQTDLVLTGSCQASLLFGSMAPDVSEHDVRTFARILLEQYAPDGVEEGALQRLSDDIPLDLATRPWTQGYELAESLHDELALDATWIDVESIIREWNIRILSRPLDDARVRGCSIYGPRHRPTIVKNENYRYAKPTTVRFTLAHELCHLLYDRPFGKQLAIASGPWAPQGIEQRANAFAAMFLMPSHLVRKAVADIPDSVQELKGVRAVAERLKVSVRAAIAHLTNLGLMSEEDRDRLLYEAGY